MTKYYRPGLEDFILGLDYQMKPVNSEVWVDCKITKESYVAVDGAFSEMHLITHDVFNKEAKNEYRIKCLDSDDFFARGFKKNSPVFIDDIMFNTYIDSELDIMQVDSSVTIQHKGTSSTIYEGIIINASMLDTILGTLDLENTANYKLRKKVTLATYE